VRMGIPSLLFKNVRDLRARLRALGVHV
jgi:hypothetical protein